MSDADKFLVPGLNIQRPWSQMILSGVKTVETRSYPLPGKYLNKPLAMIETAGKQKSSGGRYKARIIGIVVFSESFRYESLRDWKSDFVRHRVPENHMDFGYEDGRDKWGWVVSTTAALDHPSPPPRKRGIIFARLCDLSRASILLNNPADRALLDQ